MVRQRECSLPVNILDSQYLCHRVCCLFAIIRRYVGNPFQFFFGMLIYSDAGDLHYEAKTKTMVEVVGLDEHAGRGMTSPTE